MSESRVAGIKIQQNPLMRAMGYGRLCVISRQSGDRIGANVVVPAVHMPQLREGIAEHFPAYADALGVQCRVIPVGGVGAVVAGMPLTGSVPILAVTLVALLVLTNHRWTAAALDPPSGTIIVTRGYVWVTTYLAPGVSVHLLDSRELRLSTVSLRAVRLAIYDARAVQLGLPGAGPLLVDRWIDESSGTFATEGARCD